jgi:hypothetical protein
VPEMTAHGVVSTTCGGASRRIHMSFRS